MCDVHYMYHLQLIAQLNLFAFKVSFVNIRMCNVHYIYHLPQAGCAHTQNIFYSNLPEPGRLWRNLKKNFVGQSRHEMHLVGSANFRIQNLEDCEPEVLEIRSSECTILFSYKIHEASCALNCIGPYQVAHCMYYQIVSWGVSSRTIPRSFLYLFLFFNLSEMYLNFIYYKIVSGYLEKEVFLLSQGQKWPGSHCLQFGLFMAEHISRNISSKMGGFSS